ncbi:DMT family transporter [Siccirubricoccus sp. G192]|uniref:DMT family transporter n=1 Tax=Siccirubricoccus sp. G192 TaxID=2849651 RepID=UPI001C2CC2C0|nr:DMT family transporter [Siccirubricoccus sp. G192]MBV1800462.1 DMT family transporter [Siccirubricoccus sp. G192]
MTWLLLLIVWLCWGLSYPFMAWTLEAVDLITARLLANVGAGALLLLLCLRAPGRHILPHREEWCGVLALSLLIMVVFPFALIAGVMLVGPGQTAILNYTMPLWASLLAVPVLGERLDRRTLMALGLGLAAVLLVLAGTAGAEGPSGLGVTLGLAAGATFGAGTVLSKKLRFRSPVLLITAWQLLLGTPPAFAVWLLLYDYTYLHPDAGRGLFGLFYMVVFANALAYAAWFPVLGRLKASVASLSLLVVPCLGVASSALLVQRQIGSFDVAALICVLGAIALVVQRPAEPPAAEETRRQTG